MISIIYNSRSHLKTHRHISNWIIFVSQSRCKIYHTFYFYFLWELRTEQILQNREYLKSIRTKQYWCWTVVFCCLWGLPVEPSFRLCELGNLDAEIVCQDLLHFSNLKVGYINVKINYIRLSSNVRIHFVYFIWIVSSRDFSLAVLFGGGPLYYRQRRFILRTICIQAFSVIQNICAKVSFCMELRKSILFINSLAPDRCLASACTDKQVIDRLFITYIRL